MKKTNKIEWSGMPTSEAQLKEIKATIESTYNDYQTIAMAKDSLKDIFDDIHAKTGMPRRVFNFLASANYKGNALEIISNNNSLQEAYEAFERTIL